MTFTEESHLDVFVRSDAGVTKDFVARLKSARIAVVTTLLYFFETVSCVTSVGIDLFTGASANTKKNINYRERLGQLQGLIQAGFGVEVHWWL